MTAAVGASKVSRGADANTEYFVQSKPTRFSISDPAGSGGAPATGTVHERLTDTVRSTDSTGAPIPCTSTPLYQEADIHRLALVAETIQVHRSGIGHGHVVWHLAVRRGEVVAKPDGARDLGA